MPSSYPDALPDPPLTHQDVQDDVLAIAAELGVNPSGDAATVAAALDAKVEAAALDAAIATERTSERAHQDALYPTVVDAGADMDMARPPVDVVLWLTDYDEVVDVFRFPSNARYGDLVYRAGQVGSTAWSWPVAATGAYFVSWVGGPVEVALAAVQPDVFDGAVLSLYPDGVTRELFEFGVAPAPLAQVECIGGVWTPSGVEGAGVPAGDYVLTRTAADAFELCEGMDRRAAVKRGSWLLVGDQQITIPGLGMLSGLPVLHGPEGAVLTSTAEFGRGLSTGLGVRVNDFGAAGGGVSLTTFDGVATTHYLNLSPTGTLLLDGELLIRQSVFDALEARVAALEAP